MNDVRYSLGNFKFHFLYGFSVFYDIDGGIRINKAKEIIIKIDDIVNLDNILLAHFQTERIHNQRNIIVGLIEVQIIENRHAIASFDMVDDDASFYTIDF